MLLNEEVDVPDLIRDGEIASEITVDSFARRSLGQVWITEKGVTK